MERSVTIGTESDQIVFRILTLMAAELNVVDLECIHATAALTAPTVSL